MKIIVNGEVVEAGGGGGSSAGEVYSTEETRIGTWIDGKPLYRKVFKQIVPITTQWTTIFDIENLDTGVLLRGFYGWINGESVPFPNNTISLQWYNGVQAKFLENISYPGTSVTLICEYTKTTD